MSGNGDKTSGGTRNYAKQPGTLGKRRCDYDRKNSYFDKSGGFMVVHNQHNINADELDAGRKLAQKGYKIYLDSERSTISYEGKRDGRIYRSPMDMKAVGQAGANTIKTAMERAAKQGAETVVLIQRAKAMTPTYIQNQIQLFREKSPKRAREKIKRVIVVGVSGGVHRRPV